jgi:hypothetical protein
MLPMNISKSWLFIILLASPCFAYHHHFYTTPEVYTAKEARDRMMDDLRLKHIEAVNWWIDFINTKVIDTADSGSACTLIDVTVASMEVQSYLEFVYDRAGYYKTELVPGWTGYDSHRRGGHPDGKTYLSLSW